MTKRTIIWLRNDFRLSDNLALNYAYQNNNKILFLYIIDNIDQFGGASKWFLYKTLESFKKNIKTIYNANLIIKNGDAKIILADLIKKYNINCITWNRVYEPKAISRDIKIKKYFKQNGIEVKSFNSSLLFEPSTIKNLSGDYFKVFTPFWKKCITKVDNITSPCPTPKSLYLIQTQKNESVLLENLKLLPKKPNWAKDWHNIYQVSEQRANYLIDDFMQNKMHNYKKSRDFPANDNTSLISPYLHFGLISPKQIYFKSLKFNYNNGLEHFLSEIGWREFSYHLLYHFPKLPYKNFKTQFDNFPWENNQENLEKWQKGNTGFPLIDAGMRQLYKTGWMHNRVRMVVASFLTKNLLIDWRIGANWFWDCLVDADLASNYASWQWVAGSGADASPYFRIFNPITQSQKFDPQGKYIRKWVPEIANLSDKEIHCPIDRSNYFKAMIDLKSSRNKALDCANKLR